jgi:hypothetical protein
VWGVVVLGCVADMCDLKGVGRSDFRVCSRYCDLKGAGRSGFRVCSRYCGLKGVGRSGFRVCSRYCGLNRNITDFRLPHKL